MLTNFSPSAPTCQDSAGRAHAVTDPGQEVASVLGIQPRTNCQIIGDRESIELSKVRKIGCLVKTQMMPEL